MGPPKERQAGPVALPTVGAAACLVHHARTGVL